ncbi:MAG: hypothetical protein KC589_02125 [Nanoarchaeota archaeon]|nr:hypothetical protein [Nanoarchaeota archaeon]
MLFSKNKGSIAFIPESESDKRKEKIADSLVDEFDKKLNAPKRRERLFLTGVSVIALGLSGWGVNSMYGDEISSFMGRNDVSLDRIATFVNFGFDFNSDNVSYLPETSNEKAFVEETQNIEDSEVVFVPNGPPKINLPEVERKMPLNEFKVIPQSLEEELVLVDGNTSTSEVFENGLSYIPSPISNAQASVKKLVSYDFSLPFDDSTEAIYSCEVNAIGNCKIKYGERYLPDQKLADLLISLNSYEGVYSTDDKSVLCDILEGIQSENAYFYDYPKITDVLLPLESRLDCHFKVVK